MKILEITTVMRFDKYKNINYILDFTGKDYYICENGDLYWKNTKLKTEVNNEGYVINGLKSNNGKKYYIFRHQLVAQYFLIDSFKEGLTVDHINNDKFNNNVNNLRWTDCKTQIKNQVRNKTNTKVYNPIHSNKQFYSEYIKNQKEYFINNIIPKFNKKTYNLLYKIYLIYDIINGNHSEDIMLNRYAEDFIKENGRYILDRDKFYSFCFEKVKDYKTDKGIELAKQTTTNSLNIKQFEEQFLDKSYKKMELKKYCTKNFAIKEEIFKNQKTIDEFLHNLGYVLKYGNSGKILRKIKKDDK